MNAVKVWPATQLRNVTVLLLVAFFVIAYSSANCMRREPSVITSAEVVPQPRVEMFVCGTRSYPSVNQYPPLHLTIILAICGALVSSILLGRLIAKRRLKQTLELRRFIPVVILVVIITSYAWAAIMAANYPTSSYIDPTRREVTSLLLLGLIPLVFIAMFASVAFNGRRASTERS